MLGVFDPNLHLERSYEVTTENDDPRASKRRFKTWYTDAVYMPNVGKLAISSTSRDLRFWDVSTNSYFEEFHVFALTDVPTCLDYWYDKKSPSGKSLLLFGDDMGTIHLVYFLKPQNSLFATSFTNREGVQKIWMQDLPHHNKHLRHVVLNNIHSEMLRKVKYLPENDFILSSSGSSSTSLVMQDVQGKKKTYTFRMSKGVECFEYNKQLNIIATGNVDHHVRLWNPYVTEKAVAILKSHQMAVVDVVIHEDLEMVFSYCKEAIVKVWDIKEHTCLQTVVIKFPCVQNARMPEFGPFSLHLQPLPINSLVVCCGDYVASLKMGKAEPKKTKQATTHSTQLCCAMYNSHFKQVVTGADDSSIAVWDIETGSKNHVLSNAHGDEEITCMAFDSSLRRLISGARNGSIKVWNFQNGHNIHQCEAVSEAEVTGIVSFRDKHLILSVGWSRQITLYDDSDSDNVFIKAQTNWKGGQVHKDDILSVDFCPPNLVATASFDGEIIVWSVETEKMFRRLRRGQPSKVTRKLKQALSYMDGDSRPTTGNSQGSKTNSHSSRNSRPNSRHRHRHKLPKGFTAPVDKLLFLRHRSTQNIQDCAVLISSEAGYLHFWSIYGKQHDMGFFYASNSKDEEESVLAVCTNKDNSLLISGDTMGHIYVWDIEQYCLQPTREKDLDKPPLVCTWHGHDTAVVSVDFIVYDDQSFILTASTDQTARLWTLLGHYVGTFGQTDKWLLKNQASWQYPKTPWGTLHPDAEEQSNAKIPKIVENDAEIVDDNTDTHSNDEQDSESSEDESPVSSPRLSPLPLDEIKPLPGINKHPVTKITDNELDTPSMSPCISPSDRVLSADIKRVHIQSAPGLCNGFDSTESPCRDDVDANADYSWRAKRSVTFANFGHSKRALHMKTLLGHRVEENMARRAYSRQERRYKFGGVDMTLTSRFGKLCSPFQALATPATEEVRLPYNLPKTPRMVSRGLTITSEADLKDLSLTPPPMEQTNETKKEAYPFLPAINQPASPSAGMR
ncbi:cilia- and flagella-associated protein 337-like [Glandiceps talaboti]